MAPGTLISVMEEVQDFFFLLFALVSEHEMNMEEREQVCVFALHLKGQKVLMENPKQKMPTGPKLSSSFLPPNALLSVSVGIINHM